MRAGTTIRILVIAMGVVIAVACSSNKAKPDAMVDALDSFCGHPGDTGNDMGVGKFCNVSSDCNSTGATLCATLGNPQAHFCTKTCSMTGSADQCGTMATCECMGGPCGCVPNSCLGM